MSKTIYIDQDGVLAQWRSVPIWVTKLPLYFLLLKREKKVISMVKAMAAKGYDVRVLTKAYADTWAAEEKLAWLKLAGISVPVTIVPFDDSKLDYVESGDAILIDDFTPNLREWAAAGKTGIKFRNRVNGHHGTWNGASISHTMSVREMEKIVLSCM